ncbi:GGDEF domain-containing protein [Desulfovibrio cuneatus]|uniref:GGDEF domain-containing protein n=1 Tax=Desulfovibrio cuneatus TaxID=159728 RepID=UPI00041EE6D7|nr:GGDEF domain-containing protein [Desulfovibrio cuneatus]
MNKKPGPEHALHDAAMLAELEKCVGIIQELGEAAIPEGEGSALVRLVKNVPAHALQKCITAHALTDWLAIPLHTTQAKALEAIFSAQAELARQRDSDALTGIYNRGFFDRILKTEFLRATRTNAELSLVIIDIDHFKRVNDTYGHACGDIVLQRLATMLRNSCRPYDIPARIGGEEFALLLPAATAWTARHITKRLLEDFSRESFRWGELLPFSVTFSAGVASLSHMDGTPTPEGLLRLADEALYAAKESGRNCITIAQSTKMMKDMGTLVHKDEKQLLFAACYTE